MYDGVVTKLHYAVIKMVVNADSKVDVLINISASYLGSLKMVFNLGY